MAFLNEQTSRQRWTVIRPWQYAHYLHVDDGIFIGTADSESRTNDMMQKAVDSLESIGFIVKDRTACADMRKTLGYEVCTRRGRVMFPSERAVYLQEAMRWMVGQTYVCTKTLHRLMGLWIWGALLRRELLSLPHSVFRFIEVHGGARVRWWRRARQEIASMAESVCWMYVDLCAEVAPTIFATDAKGADHADNGTYAVVATDVSEELALECIASNAVMGKAMTREDRPFEGVASPEAPVTRAKPLSLLPAELLDLPQEAWSTVCAGGWKFADHIHLGESRVVLKLSQLMAAEVRAHRRKVSSLQDNTVASSMYSKGRSSRPPLNYLARRKGSYSIGSDIGLMLPRVETYRQPADGASRNM